MSVAEPLSLAPWPRVDFAAFGEVEVQPLSKIQKLTAAYLARNWAVIPHVTHQDDADVTDLEAYRRTLAGEAPGDKVTSLAFFVKACAKALVEFPQFNASIDTSAGMVVRKKYVHIGIAVDTPNGLVVPVLRDCDRKSVVEIAAETAALARKAREKGVSLAEMSGGCFSISALGALGGTGFTPIINAPEVAILGISRLLERPTRGEGDGWTWRLMAPLSLSYDHRVLNGMDAARFMTRLRTLLAAPRELAAG